MRIKIIVNDEWCTSGDMFVIDTARTADVRYDLGPYLDEGPPCRIIICHSNDEANLRELIDQSDQMELIE